MKTLFSLRFLLYAFVVGLLAACDSDDPPETPIPERVEAPADPVTVSGIAATGAALDGATVEIIDASGNLVDVGDVLTGSDGSYQVELPDGVALPVVVRVTPPGGTPLLNIVPAPEDGTMDIVANINPVTDLVASSVLGDADSADNAALAGALADVDTTMLDETGDAVVQKILGSSVQYSSFAADPEFVAKTAGGTTPPSATDAILDTLARQAAAGGNDLKTQLKNLNDQADPPRLLEEPSFQVGLVGEMVKGGTAAADLESRLSALGAIDETTEGAGDVFRAVIETVPALITSVRDQSTGIADDADLLEVAADAAVDMLASTIGEKKSRFAQNNASLATTLRSPSLQQTVAKVVQSSVVPTLATFAGQGSDSTIKKNLAAVATAVTKQAATVTSTFQFAQDSTDVSDLVSGFVSQNVAPTTPLTAESLAEAATGGGSAVRTVGDVNEAKTSIQSFAEENTDLISVPVDDLIETVPSGVWGESTWGNFNWG